MTKRFTPYPNGGVPAKKNIGSVYPEKAIDAAPGLERAEAFLTPKLMRERFLFGIPLTSPITGEKLNARHLKDFIKRGANQFELDTKVNIFPVVHRFRLPFDPVTYSQFIFLEIPHKPIQFVLNLAITSASYNGTTEDNRNSKYPRGLEIYTIPNEWVEMGNATRGIINVNPINPAFTAIGSSSGVAASGSTIMQFIGQQGWVPAYWNVEVLCGLGSKEGQVPNIVNEAVGLKATILLLDNLIPQYRIVNQSLNIDGLGQSVTNQAYSLLQDKRDQSKEQYLHLVNKIKQMTANKIFSGNV